MVRYNLHWLLPVYLRTAFFVDDTYTTLPGRSRFDLPFTTVYFNYGFYVVPRFTRFTIPTFAGCGWLDCYPSLVGYDSPGYLAPFWLHWVYRCYNDLLTIPPVGFTTHTLPVDIYLPFIVLRFPTFVILVITLTDALLPDLTIHSLLIYPVVAVTHTPFVAIDVIRLLDYPPYVAVVFMAVTYRY